MEACETIADEARALAQALRSYMRAPAADAAEEAGLVGRYPVLADHVNAFAMECLMESTPGLPTAAVDTQVLAHLWAAVELASYPWMRMPPPRPAAPRAHSQQQQQQQQPSHAVQEAGISLLMPLVRLTFAATAPETYWAQLEAAGALTWLQDAANAATTSLRSLPLAAARASSEALSSFLSASWALLGLWANHSNALAAEGTGAALTAVLALALAAAAVADRLYTAPQPDDAAAALSLLSAAATAVVTCVVLADEMLVKGSPHELALPRVRAFLRSRELLAALQFCAALVTVMPAADSAASPIGRTLVNSRLQEEVGVRGTTLMALGAVHAGAQQQPPWHSFVTRLPGAVPALWELVEAQQRPEDTWRSTKPSRLGREHRQNLFMGVLLVHLAAATARAAAAAPTYPGAGEAYDGDPAKEQRELAGAWRVAMQTADATLWRANRQWAVAEWQAESQHLARLATAHMMLGRRLGGILLPPLQPELMFAGPDFHAAGGGSFCIQGLTHESITELLPSLRQLLEAAVASLSAAADTAAARGRPVPCAWGALNVSSPTADVVVANNAGRLLLVTVRSALAGAVRGSSSPAPWLPHAAPLAAQLTAWVRVMARLMGQPGARLLDSHLRPEQLLVATHCALQAAAAMVLGAEIDPRLDPLSQWDELPALMMVATPGPLTATAVLEGPGSEAARQLLGLLASLLKAGVAVSAGRARAWGLQRWLHAPSVAVSTAVMEQLQLLGANMGRRPPRIEVMQHAHSLECRGQQQRQRRRRQQQQAPPCCEVGALHARGLRVAAAAAAAAGADPEAAAVLPWVALLGRCLLAWARDLRVLPVLALARRVPSGSTAGSGYCPRCQLACDCQSTVDPRDDALALLRSMLLMGLRKTLAMLACLTGASSMPQDLAEFVPFVRLVAPLRPLLQAELTAVGVIASTTLLPSLTQLLQAWGSAAELLHHRLGALLGAAPQAPASLEATLEALGVNRAAQATPWSVAPAVRAELQAQGDPGPFNPLLVAAALLKHSPAVVRLAAALEAAGHALCALPTRLLGCANPGCTNLSGAAEAASVACPGGCGAVVYCSDSCASAHAPRHEAACAAARTSG